MIFKIDVLKIFATFTGKHQCWRPSTFLKRDSNSGVFPVNIANFLRTFFYRKPPVAASLPDKVSAVLEDIVIVPSDTKWGVLELNN